MQVYVIGRCALSSVIQVGIIRFVLDYLIRFINMTRIILITKNSSKLEFDESRCRQCVNKDIDFEKLVALYLLKFEIMYFLRIPKLRYQI